MTRQVPTVKTTALTPSAAASLPGSTSVYLLYRACLLRHTSVRGYMSQKKQGLTENVGSWGLTTPGPAIYIMKSEPRARGERPVSSPPTHDSPLQGETAHKAEEIVSGTYHRRSPFLLPHLSGQPLPQPSPPDVHGHSAAERTFPIHR
ncbi:unnamed protein product [Pleuronectes platessa]|uniref:Uncharacterized protein n=1 Tax=Pleuronectes platessa TaxID=8262 RepID=A0A9N7U295_PLEPL|nr:unnamed protein product [Pleuronectes platessa]